MNGIMGKAIEATIRLEMSGHRAAVVGGAVRDTLLCREVRDADIATSASLKEIVSVWPGCKVIGTPPRATALLATGKTKLDIASFQGTSLTEDLGRRDLTINAMAMTSGGEIIDPWGGAADIASGVLRFTGKPNDRLSEDPLRGLRLARFASILPHFSIDPASAAVCCAFARGLKMIPLPRTGREILLAIGGDLPLFLDTLETLGLLEAALPFVSGQEAGSPDGILRRARVASGMTADMGLRAASILANAGERGPNPAVSWGWPGSLARDVENLIRWLPFTRGNMDPEIFGYLFRTMGGEWIDRLFLMGLIDCLAGHGKQMEAWVRNRMNASGYIIRLASFTDPPTGEDIIRLTGIENGPIVGKVLSAMYEAIAEGHVKNRRNALQMAEAWIREHRPENVL